MFSSMLALMFNKVKVNLSPERT